MEEYIVLFYMDGNLKEEYHVGTIDSIMSEYDTAGIEVLDIILANE